MQSGPGGVKGEWVLEFEPSARKFVEPLMGWTGQSDMPQQMRLHFNTQKDAIAYAEKHGLAFDAPKAKVRIIKPKSYSDNFRANRVE